MSSNIAFVHDWVLSGGALKVFEQLIQERIDQATSGDHKVIFTLLSDRKNLILHDGLKIKIVTALPQRLNKLFYYFSFHKIFLLSSLLDYRNLIFFYPILMKRLSQKIKHYAATHIVISSFAVAKNIEQIPHAKTFLYLHSPMQYIRSHHNDYLLKLSGIKLKFFKHITRKLRKWDLRYVQFDTIHANSKYTADLAKEIYNMDATVAYPSVHPDFYHQQITLEPSNYYVFLGRLTKLVRETDKIIELFNKIKLPLFVMGSGPDERELKAMAGDTIVFLGRIDDEKEKIDILKNARGLINLTKESFGLNTVEALLLGVPVFGLNDGASPELVDKDSGLLVDKKNFDQLDQKFLEFVQYPWNRKKIAKNIRTKLNLR